MYKRIRKFFNRLGHDKPVAPLLESEPVRLVELPDPEVKEELPVVLGPIMRLSRNGNVIGNILEFISLEESTGLATAMPFFALG